MQSLHRGRAVDRATSPLRNRDPSPDLQLFSSSVGCQTNFEKVEHPKMVSSLSQTDEEVIPPKILVSIACQTELVLPVEARPQARAAPQSSYVSQRQEMARPNLQATAPLQHLNFSPSTQSSNVFHTAFIPSGQFYPLPPELQFQQASSFQVRQQGHSSAQVFGNRPRASVATSVQQTSTTGYQALPSLERQTVTTQGLAHPTLNALLSAYNTSAYNSSQQRHSVGHPVQTSAQRAQTSHQRTQFDGFAQASGRQLYSAPQQNNRTSSLQQVANPQGAVQSRVITEIEQRRVNQTQIQPPTVGNQTTRISGQPNAIALHHGNSQQLSSRLFSQPQNQGISEGRILRNTIRPIPHYQHGNASSNQSAVHGITMQQSVSQPLGLQTPMFTQADSARPQTCQSVNLNASMIQPVQRPISQARTVSAPLLHNTRNPVPVPQSQARNLSVPVNQTTVTTQHAAQLLPVQQSVQAQSSNTYNFTVRRLTQATAERNTQIPENDLRVQPSVQSQSLFDEIRRVYSELQQSLDDVTAKKQKAKNTEKANVTVAVPADVATQLTADYVTSAEELSSVRSEDPLISQGHKLDKAHTRTSGASAGLHIEGDVAPESRKARQENNPVLSKKDRHRNPAKTPSGALENTVQRLLAHQNSTLSKHHASPKTSSSSVSDLFDGIRPVESQPSETGTSGKNENQPGCESEGVCSGKSKADKVEVDSLDDNKETNKEELDCRVTSSDERQPISEITSLADERGKETGASLASEEVNEVVPISGAGVEGQRSSNSDSVFIAPSALPNRKSDVEKDKDDIYIQLMSPVIPHGFVSHRKDSDSDNVFVVPSSPVKTRNDSEKMKDDLYVNLMSPIIPVSPSPTAKRRSHISQHYCDESETTQRKSLGEEQDSNPSVQRIESADKVINDNPDQTEIGETDYTTSPGPQSTQIQQIVRNREEDPELLTTGEEGTVDENRLIDPEIELPVAETQGGNTDTDKVKVAEGEIYEERRPTSETGQEFHVTFADKDMEVVRSVGGTADENHVVNSVDPHGQNYCSFVCNSVEEKHSEESRHKVGEGAEENAGANQGISDAHLAVGCVDACAENDSQLAPGLVAAKDSVESEDKAGEEMETDVIPDLSSPQNVVRMQDSLNIRCSQEEEMETGAKHTRRVNTQETIQSSGNVDPVGKNNFAPSNTVEEMEIDSIPELRSTQSGCGPDEEVETCVKHSGGVGTEKAQETTQNARNVDAVAEDNVVPSNAVEEIEKDATHELSSSQSVARREETWKPGCSHEEEVETSVMHSSNADSQKTQEPIENAANIDSVAEDNVALNNGLLTTTEGNSGMEESTVLSSSKCLTEDNSDGLNEQQFSGITKGISKQDHFYYRCHDSSAIKEVNSLLVEKLPNEMKNQPLESRQEPKQSLVNGIDITGILVSSNKNHDQNEKENAVKSDSSQQHLIDGSTLPIPRIAVRSVDNDLMIMWDLPDNDKISEIEYFELYSWSRGGQWRKISKVKALRLPMGCTLKNLAPGKMFRFRVRALSHGGVVGPFSEPSSFMSL